MTHLKRRRVANWAAFFVTWGAIAWGGYHAIYHPQSPLPDHWNPIKPLQITAPLTPLSQWKLKSALANPDQCQTILNAVAVGDWLPDHEVSNQCHIRSRVQVQSLSGVRLTTDTRCDLALITAMWLEHGVKPAAQKHLGQGVRSVRTQGSYNCRQIAGTQRMSQHAQAKALDVAGFTLTDGTKIELRDDWFAQSNKSAFLRAVRDASCDWFKTTLGPEYNRAHHDHFHLQSQGWGTCR